MIELLAKILRERRTNLDELAKAVGTSRQRLEGMLEGKKRFPADIFVRICRNQYICMNQLQEVAEHGQA